MIGTSSFLQSAPTGKTISIKVYTRSILTEGFVRLRGDAGGRLRFSQTRNASISDAVNVQTNTPGAVDALRTFYLGSTFGGVYTLKYELVDNTNPGVGERVIGSEHIEIEVIRAKLKESQYVMAHEATSIQFGIDYEYSRDPLGFTLLIDGISKSSDYKGTAFDLSSLATGTHTVTLRSNTFTDLKDTATLYVVKMEFSANDEYGSDEDDKVDLLRLFNPNPVFEFDRIAVPQDGDNPAVIVEGTVVTYIVPPEPNQVFVNGVKVNSLTASGVSQPDGVEGLGPFTRRFHSKPIEIGNGSFVIQGWVVSALDGYAADSAFVTAQRGPDETVLSRNVEERHVGCDQMFPGGCVR